MKNFIYLTLFPRYFDNYFQISLVNKALKKKIINYYTYNLRNFAIKGRIDDYPYGNERGMLIKVKPLARALGVIQEYHYNSYIILLSAQGKRFTQKDVPRLLSKSNNLVFVCGRYEGIDERIRHFVDEEISVGNFITMGGEMPSLTITDALIRAIPNFINFESYHKDSFTKKINEFDFDNYTRPQNFEGFSVPSILLSGDHEKIKKWRENNIQDKKKMKRQRQKNKKKITLNPNEWRLIKK